MTRSCRSLLRCQKEGIHFVPLAWESTGGATETVHETVRKWTELEGARGGYPAYLIRRNLYAQISCCLQRRLAQAVEQLSLRMAQTKQRRHQGAQRPNP